MGPVAGVPAEVPRLRAAEVARDHQILGDASGPGEAARLQAGLWPGGHRVLPVLLPILQHSLIPPRSLSCASSFGSISWRWWVPQGLSQLPSHIRGVRAYQGENSTGPKISYWHIWYLPIPVWRANWFYLNPGFTFSFQGGRGHSPIAQSQEFGGVLPKTHMREHAENVDLKPPCALLTPSLGECCPTFSVPIHTSLLPNPQFKALIL